MAIYQAGLDTGNASFETAAPDWSTWEAAHLPDYRFVALLGNDVVGWVATSATSDRCVYAGVIEESIYVSPAARGQGVGRALLHRLIEATEADDVWTLQTGIFPENTASVGLHESVGFRIVGRRERIGRHVDVWRDVLLLERRSAKAGT
jgi:L-amino acid N-acyltransferase YncA